MNACVHTYTKPQTSSTRSRGLGWRIHGSVEDTKLSTNKQHSLSNGFSWLLNVFRSSCTRSDRSFSHESPYPSRTSAAPESPLLVRRSLHNVLCGFTPDDIFTAQALRTADSKISCVCAQCARRAAAQVAPDTGTSAHAHTPGSRAGAFTVKEAPTASRFPPAT